MTRTRVTLLTGYLGSGKTTLLAHLLRDPRLADAAVLVNELGEIALDHHLLTRVDEKTVVLSSGCVCCTVRGDLADELRTLEARKLRGEIPAYRRVLIETTGVADPIPVLQTLIADPMLAANYVADGVVTTVDSVNAPRTLGTAREWVKQVALADRIVLTKLDLAGEGAQARLETTIRELNPAAPIVAAEHGRLDADEVLRAVARDPGAKLAETLAWLDAAGVGRSHGHDHDHGVTAHALRFDRPLDWSMFGIWLSMLIAARGDDVLRVKGLLDVGGTGPLLVNGVQHVIHAPVHLDAWPDGDRTSRLVVIGRGLEREALTASLETFDAVARV